MKFVVLVVVIAVAAAVVGVVSVILVNRFVYSPEGVVRSYFAALEVGDASSARALPGVLSPGVDPDQLILLQAAAYTPPSQVSLTRMRKRNQHMRNNPDYIANSRNKILARY